MGGANRFSVHDVACVNVLSMICLTLRRSGLRSRAIDRWLWPRSASSVLCLPAMAVPILRLFDRTGGGWVVRCGVIETDRSLVSPDKQHEKFEAPD